MKVYFMRVKGEENWTRVEAGNAMRAFAKFCLHKEVTSGAVQVLKGKHKNLVPVDASI